MACQPQTDIQLLSPGKFPWGCCVRDRFVFTYIYGTVADYTAAVRARNCGDVVHKGECDTLDEARALAEQHAAELAVIYDDLGRVRAVPARDYPDSGL